MGKRGGNNSQNLKQPLSSEEAREFGRRGGIASGKARRRKRMLRETIQIAAQCQVKNEKLRKMVKGMMGDEVDEDEIDLQLAATVGMFMAATKGNANAFAQIYGALEGTQEADEMEEDAMSRSLREYAEEMEHEREGKG